MKYAYGALVVLSLSDLTSSRLEHSVNPSFVFSWNKCSARFGLLLKKTQYAFLRFRAWFTIETICQNTRSEIPAKPF